MVLAIVGPTASGKTALAIDVARMVAHDQRWGGAEIVGTDSMQCYQGMTVGTAAPTATELGGVRHHMIGVWPATVEVSVAEFQAEARRVISGLHARGVLPIVVGGSGLYVSAVLDDLKFPGTDPDVRARWEQELQRQGSVALHEELRRRDPRAADDILPTNGRRIVRALEVIEITGRPFIARLPEPVDVYDTRRVGLCVPRDTLDHRIAERVQRMWATGFVDEVGHLQQVGMSRTAERALGYAQVLAHSRGELTEEAAQEETIRLTSKFARRQQRWFRRDARVQWIDYDASDAVASCLAALQASGTRT